MLAHMHRSSYDCVRAWEGPVGCACDMSIIINHVYAHLAGLGGLAGCPSIRSDTIGPVGRSQRSRHEPA